MTAMTALWFGLLVGGVVLGVLLVGYGLFHLRRRRAKHTFLRSKNGTIIQLQGPYRRRK